MNDNRYVALLRGINVGKAKRIAMAELRQLFEKMGFTRVRTILNSGNVVFDGPATEAPVLSATLESAIRERFGFLAAVVVLSAAELTATIAANPLMPVREPSKFLVAFGQSADAFEAAVPLTLRNWEPDAFAIVGKAAYLDCFGGILESKLVQEFAKATRQGTTTRNWSTVLKLAAVASNDDGR